MQMTIDAVVREKGGEEIVSVPASATVTDAVAVLAEREIGAVLVVSEDGLIDGIFTERDLLVRVVKAGRDPAVTPLSLVMTRDVRFVTPSTTVEAALALMYVHRFRHLLVIDGPRVHGLVSMRDLAFHLIRHGEGRFESALRGAALTLQPAPAPGASSS